jgi:hypothetical protein
MLGAAEIKRISQEAAARASKEHLVPYIIWKEDIGMQETCKRLPFIGDYVPKGWRLIETHFVDSSGCGTEDEPAETIQHFVDNLVENRGYAVVEAGEFQVYVGEFIKGVK